MVKLDNIYTYNNIDEIMLNEEFIKKIPLKQFNVPYNEIWNYFNIEETDWQNNTYVETIRSFDFEKDKVYIKIYATENKGETDDEGNSLEKTYYEEDTMTMKEYLGDFYYKLYLIWKNYKKAMERRRPDSVLWLQNFINYLAYAYYFEYKGNYVIGQINKGLFIPTHFAPVSLAGGVEIIKELKKYDNVVFAVTDDLAKQLRKLGFKTVPFSQHKTVFRNQTVDKTLLASSLFKSALMYAINHIKDFISKIKK